MKGRYRPDKAIKIDGNLINVNVAKITYRCEVCHSLLRLHNHGLKCTKNETHRGFIHRNIVAQIEQEQQETIVQLNQFYEIKDGRVIAK